MSSKSRKHLPKNEFSFRNLDVSGQLTKTANLRLIELLAMAPPGAAGGGVVDEVDRHFCASVLIQSPFRSFAQNAVGTSPGEVVNKVLDKLENDLFAWRYGAGSPQAQCAFGYQVPSIARRDVDRERQTA